MTVVYADVNNLVERNTFILMYVSLRLSDLGIQNLGNYIKKMLLNLDQLWFFCELIFNTYGLSSSAMLESMLWDVGGNIQQIYSVSL
jgi:hypothetical protein